MRKMDERTRMLVMVCVSAAILLAVALMISLIEGINLWSNPWSMVVLVVIVALAVVALFMAVRSLREMRSGFPLQDERSMALSMRAGNRAFYVSLYLLLLMGFAFAVLEDQGLIVSNAELLFVVVALMGSIHIIFSAYYNRKGKGLRE